MERERAGTNADLERERGGMTVDMERELEGMTVDLVTDYDGLRDCYQQQRAFEMACQSCEEELDEAAEYQVCWRCGGITCARCALLYDGEESLCPYCVPCGACGAVTEHHVEDFMRCRSCGAYVCGQCAGEGQSGQCPACRRRADADAEGRWEAQAACGVELDSQAIFCRGCATVFPGEGYFMRFRQTVPRGVTECAYCGTSLRLTVRAEE